MAATKKSSFFGTPFIILTFVLVFFVLFDIPKGIRDGTALAAGLLLSPIIGFGGRWPLLTIFLASVVLVVLTTAIRHFLTDWTKLARMQEAMRAFSGEMREARKSNNTYKLKKLTESQQDLLALQADAQKEQMKPMALTMLIVIPIFAWLGVWLAAPIVFEADQAPGGTYALVGMDADEAAYATILSPSNTSFSLTDGAQMHALRLDGAPSGAPLEFERNLRRGSVTIPTEGAPALTPAARVGTLEAGTHVARLEDTTLVLTDDAGARPNGRAVILLEEPSGWRAIVVGTHTTTFTTAGGEMFVIVPGVGTASVTGTQQLLVGSSAYTIGAANLAIVPRGAPEVLPSPIRAPWDTEWDVMDPYTWFTGNAGWFPRWIVLYSLFGIPFGQIAQRALKLWEYRHVDLDGDGKAAGQT